MARAERLYIIGIERSFLFGRRRATAQLLCSDHHGLPRARQRLRDVGVQELDATVDDDSYYTGGAYYYVQAADDDQE